MTVEYLSLQDVAKHLGVSRNSVAKYRLPEPDVRVGSGLNAARGWSVASIDAWNATRPGQGNWGKRATADETPAEPETPTRPALRLVGDDERKGSKG